MSKVSNLRQKWKSYVSRRFWILGALLLALCVLAIVQYRWIGRLAEAQRQREKANLSASLSNLESDFDIEITRVFVSFQVPFANSDYAERYKEWLQHAPYPNLIRGVYITEAASKGLLTKAAIPGEPMVPFTEWQSGLPDLGSSFAGVAVTAPQPDSVVGTQAFLQEPGSAALWVHSPVVTIEGNPAFVLNEAIPLFFDESARVRFRSFVLLVLGVLLTSSFGWSQLVPGSMEVQWNEGASKLLQERTTSQHGRSVSDWPNAAI